MNNFGDEPQISALDAKSHAQQIAFAPIVFHASLALRNLGILDLLRQHRKQGMEAEAIAAELELPSYGVKVLLEAGLGAEVVFLRDNSYFLTKTGYFVLTDSMTRVNMDFVADVCYRSMPSLKDSILNQKPVGLEHFGKWSTIYEGLTELPEHAQKSWFAFDHFYSDIAFPEVLPLVFSSKPLHIVDVGGNTGKWAKQCLEYCQRVHITILDHPAQLQIAAETLKQAGFAGRFDVLPIDLLAEGQEFPSGVDAIWMSQVLDCFSPAQITHILGRAAQGLGKQATLYILETFWDRQRFATSAFSLVNTSLYFTCIANGNSKMYHSNDLKACAQEAGLCLRKETDSIGIGHTLLEYRLA